jgi:hypothetical protein
MFIPSILNDRKALLLFSNKLYTFAFILAMKRVISSFLLFIFLFNILGYFIAFKAVQYNVRTEIAFEIKQGLNSNTLTKITVNKNKLSLIDWKEAGSEMLYKGKLYDIVKSTENSTSITYYCLGDEEEERLLESLDEHINTHIASGKPFKNDSKKNIVDQVLKLYFAPEANQQFFIVYSIVIRSEYKNNYSSIPGKMSFLPPECI